MKLARVCVAWFPAAVFCTAVVGAALLSGACSVSWTGLDRAQLQCADDDECLIGSRCVGARCVPDDSPCLAVSGAPVADGTACGAGVCVAAVCRERGCGDGYLDVEAGEQCDPAAQTACRADCTLPFCGDGIVDPGEACDDDSEACAACVFLCPRFEREGGTANCDGALDNGCECPARPSLAHANTLDVLEAAVGRHHVYAVVTAVDDATAGRLMQVARRSADDDEVEAVELVSAPAFIRLASTEEGSVTAFVLDAAGRHLWVFDDDGEATRHEVPFRAAIALIDGELISADSQGLWRSAPDGSDETLWSLSCAFALEVVGCGAEVLCLDFGVGDNATPDLVAVNRQTARTRVLAPGIVGSNRVRFGCLADVPVWLEQGNLLVSDNGERAVFFAPTVGFFDVSEKGHAVFSVDDGLAFAFNPLGTFEPHTVRYSPSGGPVGLAAGIIVAAGAGAVVVTDDLHRTLIVLER
jgi:hypothetical protein